MNGPYAFTRNEIISQPSVWAQALQTFHAQAKALTQFWQSQPVDQVIFTGCGSTYYLSLTAAALFQALTGIPCVARPASELALFPNLVYPPAQRIMLGVISRSGETTETIESVSVFRERTRGRVLAITCDSHSTLAKAADIVLAADFAQEQSFAQTRSFSSMLILAQALAGHLAGQDVKTILSSLPDTCDRLLSEYHDLSRQSGEAEKIDRFFFLGAGYQYGVACEAMLKMKEMSLSHSEAFHPLEFRHGPMSMVNEHTLVVGLISDEAHRQEVAVLNHMRRLGGDILAMADFAGNEFNALGEVIRLQSGLPAWARPALYLPNLQLMAYYRAMARGQNPDRPHNLAAVIKIDTFR